MTIKVAIIANDSLERVWECWTQAEHIKEWYHPSDSWYVPSAEVDFKEGGKFKIKLAAMDKSGAGAFDGVYTKIELHKKICFTIDDGRKVVVKFEVMDNGVLITEEFEASSQPQDAQEMGWQLLLRSFKHYVEG